MSLFKFVLVALWLPFLTLVMVVSLFVLSVLIVVKLVLVMSRARVKKLLSKECVAELIEELGLIPSSLITPSLLDVVHRELRQRSETLDKIESEIQEEFLEAFAQRARMRKNSQIYKMIEDSDFHQQLTLFG